MKPAKKHRTVIFYKDYFEKFFIKQQKKVKAKIIWTIELIEVLERVPKQYLKHIQSTDGLYEIRVKHATNIFRVFCFFDKEKLIILANGFRKKTQKVPKNEIAKALKIMKEYKNEK
ncbi:MAG: type II toxin-antitoxin system RelE/ParE family toxin [Melioribacteraceae bacterium]|nr:type II toxin-antitoxin system RelE/ParE family toxin [Melioribacteraceae bacterium]